MNETQVKTLGHLEKHGRKKFAQGVLGISDKKLKTMSEIGDHRSAMETLGLSQDDLELMVHIKEDKEFLEEFCMTTLGISEHKLSDIQYVMESFDVNSLRAFELIQETPEILKMVDSSEGFDALSRFAVNYKQYEGAPKDFTGLLSSVSRTLYKFYLTTNKSPKDSNLGLILKYSQDMQAMISHLEDHIEYILELEASQKEEEEKALKEKAPEKAPEKTTWKKYFVGISEGSRLEFRKIQFNFDLELNNSQEFSMTKRLFQDLGRPVVMSVHDYPNPKYYYEESDAILTPGKYLGTFAFARIEDGTAYFVKSRLNSIKALEIDGDSLHRSGTLFYAPASDLDPNVVYMVHDRDTEFFLGEYKLESSNEELLANTTRSIPFSTKVIEYLDLAEVSVSPPPAKKTSKVILDIYCVETCTTYEIDTYWESPDAGGYEFRHSALKIDADKYEYITCYVHLKGSNNQEYLGEFGLYSDSAGNLYLTRVRDSHGGKVNDHKIPNDKIKIIIPQDKKKEDEKDEKDYSSESVPITSEPGEL